MIDSRTAPYGAFILRVALGGMFIAHALLKYYVFTLPGTAKFFESLGLPGPEGMQAARLPLNTKEVRDASRISRAETRAVLEKILKRLATHQFIPYPMEHSGTEAVM